jgi:cellulose synthase/poly-beta-1,6-N-acetylglucosamine synthase-like glycosyltransferase
MTVFAALLLAAPLALALYAYAIYPIALRLIGARRRRRPSAGDAVEWPTVSIVVVAHNAQHTIRGTIERLLAVDYPPDRRQILIVSDASTDGTDHIVGEFAHRGVELHRVEPRSGKTAAENVVAHRVRGEIVVNADASILVTPSSVKSLVRRFFDSTVGVASGRAVSVPSAFGAAPATRADAAYYSYEMWTRSLEMDFGTVIGATGALYAVRRALFAVPLAPHVTRDFASPLVARECGLRSVIDDDAVCFVRQTPSLRREYDRKVRTMVRGLDTLYEFRHLMDPRRHGRFALMLASHKLCRWLVYLLAPLAAVGVAVLAVEWWPARVVAALALLVGAGGLVAVRWPVDRPVPAPLAFCGYAVVGGAAGAAAWVRFLRGKHTVIWEPTTRAGEVVPASRALVRVMSAAHSIETSRKRDERSAHDPELRDLSRTELDVPQPRPGPIA